MNARKHMRHLGGQSSGRQAPTGLGTYFVSAAPATPFYSSNANTWVGLTRNEDAPNFWRSFAIPRHSNPRPTTTSALTYDQAMEAWRRSLLETPQFTVSMDWETPTPRG